MIDEYETMKCPDCKIEMELRWNNEFATREYWKCPRCQMEIDVDDEDHEGDE